jgi:hypothetical protein
MMRSESIESRVQASPSAGFGTHGAERPTRQVTPARASDGRSRIRSARRRGERGETLIEFAFASLIFFTMVFGAVEFGIAVWNYNLVSDLAQEGARFAAVHGQRSTSPIDESGVNAYVQTRATGLLTGAIATTPSGAPNTKSAGDVIAVRVDYTIVAGGGLLPFWNIPVYATAQMIVAR